MIVSISIRKEVKKKKKVTPDRTVLHAGLRCAVLQGGRSVFWRPQRGKPSSWLATAEAVHLSVTRLLALQGCQGNVDDLLFFFKFFYAKIRSRYKVRQGKTTTCTALDAG